MNGLSDSNIEITCVDNGTICWVLVLVTKYLHSLVTKSISAHFAALNSPGLTKTWGAILSAEYTIFEPVNDSMDMSSCLSVFKSVTAEKWPFLTDAKAPFKQVVTSEHGLPVTMPYLNTWPHVLNVLCADSIAPLRSISCIIFNNSWEVTSAIDLLPI